MARKKDLMKVKGIKGEISYSKILDKYGKMTVDILATVSPKSRRPGRKTPYSKGWVARHTIITRGERVTVWNRTNWQLTHLLENGHFITNRRSGIAWSQPIPHIHPTYRKVAPKFVKAMEKAKVKVELE